MGNIPFGQGINSIIPESIIFRINFNTSRYDLPSVILNTNFTNLLDNNMEAILAEINRRHDWIDINDLRVIRYSENLAYIYPVNSNNFTTNFVSIELNPRNHSTRQQLHNFISNQNVVLNINDYRNNYGIPNDYSILLSILHANNINNNLNHLFRLRNFQWHYNTRTNFFIGGRFHIYWNTLGDMSTSNSSSRGLVINFSFNRPWRFLRDIIVNTDFGEISDLSPNYIENLVINRYPELRNQITIGNIGNNNAMVIARNDSNYFGNVLINFRRIMIVIHYNKKIKINDNATNSNLQNQLNTNAITKLSDNLNLSMNSKINESLVPKNIKKAVDSYNSFSKEAKLQKLNEINQYYQNLSENDKKNFKEKLTNSGLAVLSGGALTAYGAKMTVNISAASVINTEAVEMTPLLSASTSETLTAAETITITETAAVEGGAIVGETSAATILAPETLGLSLVIGGLAIAGTWMYFAFHTHSTSDIMLPTLIHHNVYNNIEKWYKFLAHDKLKIKINKNTWNEIKQNKNLQANITKIIKNEFAINDHSGWGGSITNEDFNTLAKVILLHFEQINSYFEILDNENEGFIILTNTEGDWLGIE